MRLPKIALVAAACALTSLTARAQTAGGDSTRLNGLEQINADRTIVNPVGGAVVFIAPDTTLTFVNDYATTVEAAFFEGPSVLGVPVGTATAQMVAVNGTVFKTDLLTGELTGGNIVKQGGGVLQINSWTTIRDGDTRRAFVGPGSYSFVSGGVTDVFIVGQAASKSDFAPFIQPEANGAYNTGRLNGVQGSLTIDQGILRLSGFLNLWHDMGEVDVTPLLNPDGTPILDGGNIAFPARIVTDLAAGAVAGESASPDDLPIVRQQAPLARRMTGINSVILNGSAVIDFTNSPRNIAIASDAGVGATSGTVDFEESKRLNFLRNLKAGLEGDMQQTEVIAGTTPEYRVVLHIDQGQDGSIGILAGAGSYIKTGAGSFSILNSGRLTGSFTAAGGRTILASGSPNALLSAESVNIAGIPDDNERDYVSVAGATSTETNLSRRGRHLRTLTEAVDINGDTIPDVLFVKGAYSPDVGTHVVTTDPLTGLVTNYSVTGAQLEILSDQVIRNFQANFAYRSASTDVETNLAGLRFVSAASAIQNAADGLNSDEPVIPGSAKGSQIILNDNSLTIRQDRSRDGFYEGSIIGGFDTGARFETGGTDGEYIVSFDKAARTGRFQLSVISAPTDINPDGGPGLTDSTSISNPDEIRANLAAALGLSMDNIQVSDYTSQSGGAAVAWKITISGTNEEIGQARIVDLPQDRVRTGTLILDATDRDASLALALDSSSSFAETIIANGRVIANAQGLGNSLVDVANGELIIYQPDAADLRATIVSSGIIRVVAQAYLDNGNTENLPISINSAKTIGELNFAQQQRRFTGDLVVNDGVDLSLSLLTQRTNNTLYNARSITLDGSTNGVGSRLSFNDTDQLIRNLTGDALSSIRLGRGTMYLEQNGSQSFLGLIEGAGSVIKSGAGTFTIPGSGRSDYSGATVVREGAVVFGSADALRRGSSLVLTEGATATSSGHNQIVGALFGEQGSTLSMGSAILTVGFTAVRYQDLAQDIFVAATANDIESLPLSHNYLGTTDALEAVTLPGLGFFGPVGAVFFNRAPLRLDDATELDFIDGTLGMADQTRIYLAEVAYRFDRNKDGVIDADEEALAADSAANLDFAGNITGTGAAQTVRYGSNDLDRDNKVNGVFVDPTYQEIAPLVSLNKIGYETLFLSGTNAFTGAAVVRQGTLRVNAGSIASASAVYVLGNSWSIDLDGNGTLDANLDIDDNGSFDRYDANGDGVYDVAEDGAFDGTLSVNVDTGASATWATNVLGDGNFAKAGGGSLLISGSFLQHTGLTRVEQGTLDIQLVPSSVTPANATLGNVELFDGATIVLRTDGGAVARDYNYINTITAVGPLGTGNFTKAGAGVLTISGNRILSEGTISVAEGTLRLDTLPNLGGFAMLEIAAGAKFDITIAAATTQTLGSDIMGSGQFIKNGTGTLVLLQDTAPLSPAPGSGFTGSIILNAGVTQVGLPGSLRNSRFDLRNAGTTLQLVNGAHEFAGLVGESGTIFDLINNGTTLTLNVPSNTTPDSFLGRFINSGNLTKTGAGTLRLAPTGGVNNIDTLRINGGKLIATLDGLGGVATIDVGAGGELEFESTVAWDDRTAPAPLSIIYTQNITGAGKVSKSGIGDILLSGAGLLPTGGVDVEAGTLIVDDRRFGGQIPPGVTVQQGATFELLLTANRTLTNQVSGSGNFAVSGEHLLTVGGNPLYTGKTILRSGADLGFVDAAPVLGGLEAEDDDNVVSLNAGTRLTLNTTDPVGANFAGSFLLGGVADLVIKGTSAFRYVNDVDGGNLGGYIDLNVTVDGGILQVGLGNTKPITLTAGGTLQIFADLGEDGKYSADATITIDGGASQIIKVGEGTLDITDGLPSTVLLNGGVFQRLLVQEGNARVTVTESGITGFNQLAVSGEGALELSVASGTGLITDPITAASSANGGFIAKSGEGALILKAGISTTAELAVREGIVQLGQSASDGASLGGDVTVLAGATLTGSGTIAGSSTIEGTLRPGYSPGTITVAGPHTFVTGSTFDVEVSGALSDRLVANGTFTIQPGATLKVAGWDDPATAGFEGAPIGARYTIVQAAGTLSGSWDNLTTVAPAASSDAAQTTAYLVAYPGQNLGRPGVIDAIIVRSTPAGALATTPLVTAPVGGISADLVSRLSDLTRVEVDASGNVTDMTSGDLGQRLAALTPSEAPGALRSLTGMGYLSGIGMAHLSASSDAEEISRRLEQRRYDRGYMSVKPRQFFVTATSGKWDAGDELTSANYDIRRNGMIAGADWDVGMDAIVGWAVALDQSKASLDGGGSVESTHARVMGYASTMLMDDMAYAQAGVSLGHATMDATRSWFAFNVNSSPSTFTAAAWARAGTVASLGRGTVLSPFLQVDASHANQKGFKETGNADTALAVESLSQTAIRGRVGFSLAHFWDTDRGDWRYRVSVDVAHVLSLSGETMSVRATNSGELGSAGDITATANPLDEGGLVIAPAISLGPDNDTTYSLSAEIRQLDGGNATSLNLTYRRRF